MNNNDAIYTLIQGISFVLGFIPLLLMPILLRKYTKRMIMLILEGINVFPSLILFFIGWNNVAMVIITTTITTFVSITTSMMFWMAIPQCSDYAEWKTGANTKGVISAGVGLVNQLASALAAVVGGAILTGVGFIPKALTQTPEVMDAIFQMRVWPIVIAYAISVIALYFYPINKKTEQQMQSDLLESRKKRKEHIDRMTSEI